MYPAKLSDVDQSVRARFSIERRIVKRTVADLLAAGFELAVHDGEDWHERTTDAAKLHKQLMETAGSSREWSDLATEFARANAQAIRAEQRIRILTGRIHFYSQTV